MKAGILIGHLSVKGNEGAIIRTAEAFGISNVFVLGKKMNEYKSSEGCDRHVNFFEFETSNNFIDYSKTHNHHIVCIENVNDAKEIDEIKRYPSNPIFITGNESKGVPKEFLDNCSIKVKIKQGDGYANCLNTSTALAIVVHDFYRKHSRKRSQLWETSGERKK